MSSTYFNRRHFLSVAASAATAVALPPEPSTQAAWIELFNGRNLDGWRPSEHRSSWTVSDGALQANGPRSHLFYEGPVQRADFRNFELQVEVVSQPQCNSGIYFHTAYQETGFPDKGFEIQINNTALGEGGYLERKRTGSLYGLRNMYKQLAADGTPMRFSIAVRGKNVQVRLGGQLLVDYWEPTPPVIPAGGEAHRYLDHGTFALQCHNDGSRAAFHSVRVRPLPDDLPLYTVSQPQVDETYRDIINLGRHNLPTVDYQVRLVPGLNVEQALQKSRRDGLQYGFVRKASEFATDGAARQWAQEMKPRPAFAGLCADGRGWTKRITQETARQFDYVTFDSRTLTSTLDGNREQVMDALLSQTVEALNSEPVDIYAFPTYLPKALRSEADQVWNERRTAALIEALVKNKVAVELNSSERLPNQQFIESAKQAGCKFAFGTGNQGAGDLKRSEYGIAMTRACKLDWQNFFDPGAWWPKAAERRWSA